MNTNDTTDSKSLDELKSTLESLSCADKLRVAYQLKCNKEHDKIKEWNMFLLDWLETDQIINDYKTKTSDASPAIAMVHTASVILRTSMETQARLEMQAQDQSTQWAMQLADAMSDLACQLEDGAQQMATLMAHYQACLEGRRAGIAFTGEDGSSIIYQDSTTEE